MLEKKNLNDVFVSLRISNMFERIRQQCQFNRKRITKTSHQLVVFKYRYEFRTISNEYWFPEFNFHYQIYSFCHRIQFNTSIENILEQIKFYKDQLSMLNFTKLIKFWFRRLPISSKYCKSDQSNVFFSIDWVLWHRCRRNSYHLQVADIIGIEYLFIDSKCLLFY